MWKSVNNNVAHIRIKWLAHDPLNTSAEMIKQTSDRNKICSKPNTIIVEKKEVEEERGRVARRRDRLEFDCLREPTKKMVLNWVLAMFSLLTEVILYRLCLQMLDKTTVGWAARAITSTRWNEHATRPTTRLSRIGSARNARRANRCGGCHSLNVRKPRC